MEKKQYIQPGIIEVLLNTTSCLMLSEGEDGNNPTDAESKFRNYSSDDSESSSEFFPTNFGDF